MTYSPVQDFSFTADQTAVPLLHFEVVNAAKSFPIIFPKQNHVIPYAVLGLGNKNIFVDARGKWISRYLPLMFANHPFSLIDAVFTENDKRKHEYGIAIQEDAPHFKQSDGLPLYNENGEANEILQRIRASLALQFRQHKELQPALDELQFLDCLDERPVTVTTNGITRAVHGLRCVNRDKFIMLPIETLQRLKKSGVTDIVNAHWESLKHLPLLLEDPSCPNELNKNN